MWLFGRDDNYNDERLLELFVDGEASFKRDHIQFDLTCSLRQSK